MRCRKFVTILVVSWLTVPPALGETLADGLKAFDAGDYPEAVRIWRGLAEAGDPSSQLALAGLYRTGTYVALDLTEAARLYRAAADRGDASAQLNLGDLTARGLGLERDLVEAYKWLGLAAVQGRAWAEERQREVAGDMTKSQITEAEARIRAFRPKPHR